MPEISRFHGVIVRMYAEAGEPHHTPHFHVYSQDDVAVYSIVPIELMEGTLPRRQQRLVEAWGELHQAELMEDWLLLEAGEKPFPIDPLE